ncbi:Ubiquitin carboxyl-terminal hydrolase 37 [Holothuria leucospilota]|uniref:Ubiquitin carboxyl-terminal hydrolase n=1 Tax=Holothuria leucospilota TaxID=206669 RepID=A0A9Q1BCI4_HOLLE|nr:Ubiquitin carboxyl-terminal hydrolase 37 [Holothuria leucospilota]
MAYNHSSNSEKVLHTVEGNVKFFGMDCGAQSWKTGGLAICQLSNGQHICRMYFAAGQPKVFHLSNRIKTVTSVASNPNRCIIQLKTGCNITIDKGRKDQVATLVSLVKSLMGKYQKTPNRPVNGFQRSPGRSLGNSQKKSISPTRQNHNSPRSQLFSHVGESEYQKTLSVRDFEKEPITKLPFFTDEDDDDDQFDKENVEMLGSSHKKTPFQMRMEGKSSLFKESKEEKFNTLKEKKSNELNTNYIASSFYGSRGQSTSNYASVDRFKVNRSFPTNSIKSPSSQQFKSSVKKPFGSGQPVFSFKPKSSAKFVSKSGLYPSKTLQGFSNLGNTCYMNAILQSLYGLKSFRDDLIHSEASQNLKGDTLTHAIKVLFLAKHQNKPREAIRKLLLRVKNAISKSATRFSGYLQHDAQEFLCQCMDQLKEDTEKMNKAITEIETDTTLQDIRFSPPTTDNLEFAVLHTIRCLECGETVTKEEVFHDLSLDMPKRSKLHPSTIQVALDQFFESEDINYACEKCEGKDARLSHKFTRLSRYIILNLKRYVFNQDSSQNAKLQENILIPKYLTLSRHCMETVQKPCDRQETPSELPMRESSSPRRKLSFDTREDWQGNSSISKRQKLDFSTQDDSPELLPTETGDKVQQENGSEMQVCPTKDLSTMTEEEQIAYVIQLSKSETPRKVDVFPTKSSTPQKPSNQESVREETMSSTSAGENRRKSLDHDSDCQKGADPGIAPGFSWEKIVSMSNKLVAKRENSEKSLAVETSDKEDDVLLLPDAKLENEKNAVFKIESDSDGQESGDNKESQKVNSVGGGSDKKEPRVTSERKMSNEELEAKEEEELRKAKELSLQEQNDVTLREEEELRKAQELSLQEYQKSSPPLIISPVQDESPEKPLYSREEWSELAKNAEEGDMPNSYRLVSVVSHMGSSLTTGHYVSDVYDSKTKSWLSCDDSNVTVISESRVREDRRRTGYIFFYERV